MIGATLSLREVLAEDIEDESGVVLATAEACTPCELSRRFDETLFKEAIARGVRVAVLIPDTDKNQPSFDKRVRVQRVNFRSVGVFKHPTLLIVDALGKITDLWAGRMTEREEERALARVAGNPKASPYAQGDIAEAAWVQLEPRYNGILLDVRERKDFARYHRQSAANIPVDEVEIRSRHELDQTKPVVIDCTSTPEARCRVASEILSIQGFESVAVLNPGSVAPQCALAPKKRNGE